jgi:hypothetical protein
MHARRRLHHEAELLESLQTAVQSLRADGERLSGVVIAHRMHMAYKTLRSYPRVREALRSLQEMHVKGYAKKAQLTEQSVRGKAHQAMTQIQNMDQPLTVKRIARYSDLSAETLRAFPGVWDEVCDLIAKAKKRHA